MIRDAALLVVDGLQGIVGVEPVRDAVPPERPRAVPLSREEILARLTEWEADYVAGQAVNTVKALRSDWNQYLAWCEGTRTPPLPLSVTAAIAYVDSMIDRNKKRATIDRHLFSIGTIHDAAELPNPIKHPSFRRKFKRCIKRLVSLGRNVSEQATPLTRADVDAILASLDLKRLVHLRDAALIALAADTLCRESELVAATVEQFVPNDVDGNVSFDVGVSKTNQEGKHDYRFVSPETYDLIAQWQARAGISAGPLFPAISGRKRRSAAGGATYGPGPMHAQEVARIFRKRALGAGISKATGISGHSTRIGGANELACAGEDVRAIADAGGWRDLKQVMHYTQAARAGLGAQARLYRARKKKSTVG